MRSTGDEKNLAPTCLLSNLSANSNLSMRTRRGEILLVPALPQRHPLYPLLKLPHNNSIHINPRRMNMLGI